MSETESQAYVYCGVCQRMVDPQIHDVSRRPDDGQRIAQRALAEAATPENAPEDKPNG